MQFLKKRIRRRAGALLLALLLVSLCTTGAAAVEQATRTVRVPCNISALLRLDENGQAAGPCADYLDRLAEINRWEYEYIPTTWPEAVEQLESGEIDLLFPVNRTQDREDTMDFPSLAGGYTANGLFARADSGYDYEDFSSFDGARIAVTAGSADERELEEFARQHGFSFQPVYAGGEKEKIEALNAGEADMALFSAAGKIPGGVLLSVLDAVPFYYTVREGNDALLSELERGMQQILKEDPDLLAETANRCLVGDNEIPTALTAEEHAFVDSGRPIVVGFYEDSNPLAFVTDEGEYDGIYIELMKHMKEQSGLNLTPYSIARTENWNDLLRDGTIDFYAGASDTIISDEDNVIITAPYLEYTNLLVTRNNFSLNSIQTPVIAMTYGRANWESALSNRLGLPIQVVYYQTAKECLLAVAGRKADYCFINNMEFNYHIKNDRLSILIRWPQYRFLTSIGLAASGDCDPVLFSAVNKAVQTLDPDDVASVTEEYLNIPYHSYSLSDYLYNNRTLILGAGTVLLVAATAGGTVLLFRRKQRHQLQILAALSRDYAAIYYSDLDQDHCELIQLDFDPMEIKDQSCSHSSMLRAYIEERVLPEYREALLPLCDTGEVLRRFQEEPDFSVRYQVAPRPDHRDFFEMHFVDISPMSHTHKMVFGIRCVDEAAKAERQQKQLLRDALEAANRANSAKTDFLSRMSHDIRTPMNAIVGMTAIARTHVEDPARVLDALGKIDAASRHLLALINEVLDMSKIESGTVTLSEDNFNLSDLINGVLTIVRPQAEERGQQLEVRAQDNLHEDVIGDSLRLQQVFTNLISNAIKYTPDGGKITVTVCEKPGPQAQFSRYEITVADNGIGMTKEFCQHIFEPFTRAEDPRISKIPGTGLGMSIVQNIVRMMNGTITVESEPGRGSVFTAAVSLKLRSGGRGAAPAAAPTELQAMEEVDFTGHRALLVEDNELNLEIAREVLEMTGLSVEEARDGKQAVDQFSAAPEGYYELILMDIQMPVMNGYQATAAIRSLPRAQAKTIPIVAMTANAFAEDIQDAKSAGMNDHLAKPIDFAKLSAVLRKYLV